MDDTKNTSSPLPTTFKSFLNKPPSKVDHQINFIYSEQLIAL